MHKRTIQFLNTNNGYYKDREQPYNTKVTVNTGFMSCLIITGREKVIIENLAYTIGTRVSQQTGRNRRQNQDGHTVISPEKYKITIGMSKHGRKEYTIKIPFADLKAVIKNRSNIYGFTARQMVNELTGEVIIDVTQHLPDVTEQTFKQAYLDQLKKEWFTRSSEMRRRVEINKRIGGETGIVKHANKKPNSRTAKVYGELKYGK